MNLEFFIARRLLKGDGTKAIAVPIIKIALVGIVLGVCVMLLSVFIITGFKKEITSKLSGFTAHLDVSAYQNNNSYNVKGVHVSDTLLNTIKEIKEVKEVYAYATKPAILKSETEIHGIILKGIDSLYSADFYRKHLKTGKFPDFSGKRISNGIILSGSVANLLDVKTGDKLTAHFVQEPPRVRQFVIEGIYETGFKEYDDMLVLCDIRHIQRLNNWPSDEVSGIAVELKDIQEIPYAEEQLDYVLPMNSDGGFYRISTLHDTAPQIFDWLNLLNMNVWIILVLIVTVAGFNMVSGLLILILDKTSMIGVLKALGYKDGHLRRLFLYIGLGLIGRGMIIGNILAFILGGIQYYFRPIKLDPVTYYMDTVPINFDIWYILLLNIGVLVVSILMLIVPTMLVSKIKPIKAIRFD